MDNDDLHTPKRYEEKLGDNESHLTHHNWCRVCYRHGKGMLSMFYCEECRVCVCLHLSDKDKVECASVIINSWCLVSKINEELLWC